MQLPLVFAKALYGITDIGATVSLIDAKLPESAASPATTPEPAPASGVSIIVASADMP